MAYTFAGYLIDVKTREEAIEHLKKYGYNNLKPNDLSFIKND